MKDFSTHFLERLYIFIFVNYGIERRSDIATHENILPYVEDNKRPPPDGLFDREFDPRGCLSGPFKGIATSDSLVGGTLGTCVGGEEGSGDGSFGWRIITVGPVLDSREGLFEDVNDGSGVASIPLIACDGVALGRLVDIFNVGAVVGSLVGFFVGISFGPGVGLGEGFTVGVSFGAFVGVLDG